MISVKQARAIGMTDTQICDLIQAQQERHADYMRNWRANVNSRDSRELTSAHITERKKRKKELPSIDVLSSTSISGRAKRKPTTPFPDPWPWPIELNDSAEFDRFKAHALANDRRQVRWDQAWRSWQLSPYNRTPNGGQTNGNRRYVETIEERGKRLADACRRREQELGKGLFRPIDDD